MRNSMRTAQCFVKIRLLKVVKSKYQRANLMKAQASPLNVNIMNFHIVYSLSHGLDSSKEN